MNNIVFDGKYQSIFNMAVCAYEINANEQMLVLSFGYESQSGFHVSIPLPPGVHEFRHHTGNHAPLEFFSSLDRNFGAEPSTGALLQRHRLQGLDQGIGKIEAHTNQEQSVVSVRCDQGARVFGPLSLRMLRPYEDCLWLPRTKDSTQQSYVIASHKLQPENRTKWVRTAYPLVIATTSGELGPHVDISGFAWRHRNGCDHSAVIGLEPQTKSRQEI